MAHRKLAIFRRRTFTALAVLSLLLCIATLALWVRSYWTIDGLRDAKGTVSLRAPVQYDDEFRWMIDSVHGSISLTRGPGEDIFGPSTTMTDWFGFGYLVTGERIYSVWVPHWFLALLSAILPALHLRSTIRSRHLRRIGHCPRCGYDLRATPERCPERGFSHREHGEHRVRMRDN